MEEIRYADAKQPTKSGAIEMLDEKLNELEDALEQLERVTASVRSQYLTTAIQSSEPHAEPPNAIRGRIERLANNISRLRALAQEIDL